MDLWTILLLGAIFLFTVSIVELVYLAWSESRFVERKKIKRRLMYISAGGGHGQEKLSLYRERVLRDAGAWQRFTMSFPRLHSLDRMLLKTNLPINATTLILISLALGGIGFAVGFRVLPQMPPAVAIGLLLLSLPYLMLWIVEKRYYAKFQEQLPEALDLLARAVRSGHALTSGLEMIAEEIDDPIKSEFGATVDEINLGLTLHEALDNLCERVPSTDLRFFSIAVVVQKQTGGNVAEILDNISRLIRERIQFARQVKALTAEGRYSAGVLIALPFVMFLYMYFVRNDYISLLWTEKVGQQMIGGALLLMFFGALVIRKIVRIDI